MDDLPTTQILESCCKGVVGQILSSQGRLQADLWSL